MSESSLNFITPCKPVAPYVGGKRLLAKRLVADINAVPHTLYAEVFMGMGGVFLRRDRRPVAEVINDYSRDVATFFRILQRHYTAFMEMMRYQITTRAEFERLVKTDTNTLTDLERAARLLYLQRTAFGGKVKGRTFGVVTDGPARFDITRLAGLLDDLHSRLAGVVIECLTWSDFISSYDRAGTLFYLDPPYYNCEDYYGDGMFEREDFERMAALLSGIKGRFILSLNDRPEVRRIFGDFEIARVETSYSVGQSGRAKFSEVIISN